MLHLLPVPQHMQMRQGAYPLMLDSYIVLPPMADSRMRVAAAQLQAEFEAGCGFAPAITCGKARPGDIALTLHEGPAQGYELTIDPAGVTIAGGGPEGMLHGAQTLRQVIRQCGWHLPALHIADAPVFAVRGFYHDQTRGRVAKLDFLKQLADEMCLYKMNQLQLYVEHTYLFRDVPELWATAGTPLTAQDILALDDYCAARGIELVPSLSSFGHLMELLRTKRFQSLCVLEEAASYPSTMPNRLWHHTIDPENEGAFPLVAALIDEFMPLFRSDKFNICCDETFDLGQGKHQGHDVGALYMGFLKKLCAHVVSRGKTPMFWGDIVLQHPEALAELPEGAICLNWNYAPGATEEGTRAFHQAGAVQYVCPGVSSWNYWLPCMSAAYENIRSMAAHGRKYGAVGLLNTDWGDFGHISDPRFSLPGMVAGACAAWGALPAEEELWRQLSCIAYGDANGQVLCHVADIARVQNAAWWLGVCHKDRMTGCLERLTDTPPLSLLPDADAARAEAVIGRAVAGMQACALHMPTEHRPMVRRWMIAAEAIRLWVRIQQTVPAGKKDEALAGQIERFLHRYEAMWREISQESELWRVRDVMTWYAQELR